MFLKRTLAVLLSATMLFGMTSLSTTAATTDTEAVSAGNYYNASYLENYASNAYNEQNLGANYSKSSTEFKVWSPIKFSKDRSPLALSVLYPSWCSPTALPK